MIKSESAMTDLIQKIKHLNERSEGLERANQSFIEEIGLLHKELAMSQQKIRELEQQLAEQRMYYERAFNGGQH